MLVSKDGIIMKFMDLEKNNILIRNILFFNQKIMICVNVQQVTFLLDILIVK